MTIRGQALAGAVVSINGELVELDGNGSFSLRVALEEGANFFEILATDEDGTAVREELTIFFLRR